ncbi:prepilin-type N-terminal cleavage/methylation domain-containing protein [Sideroxydans sp. CL21]|uniref:pilin n=1 Tax=Sideroxydans sp. CL21 TaxID=2600596 RepID=UPI0024BD5A96|nr:prepilin-type N-terminal cleavage/methylation domain-containing protein [Sideroxydans sp. CL21]
MKQVQKGFTLIELMIVVAIIGILAAVAIPAYQDYVVKAKLSKVQSTMDSIKLALAMYYQENGSFPLGTATQVTNPGTAGTTEAVGATDVWTSIGLSTFPTLPPEVSALDYNTNALGDSFALTLTIATGKIKAGTIDGAKITITPSIGVPAGGPPPATAAGTSVVGTAIVWHYACSLTGGTIDPILTKYFNNAGVACTATSA